MDRPSTMRRDGKNPSFIQLKCVCGRNLRAKPDQVGTEIRCWDCQTLVTVAVPREKQKVARDFWDGFYGVIKGPGLRSVLVAAVLVTPAFCIPRYGIAAAGVILAFEVAFYGEVIRRVSRVVPDDTKHGWKETLLPRSFSKPLLWALLAAGTVFPLWGLNPGLHHSPHWTRRGMLIAGMAWTLLPIGLLFAYASDRTGRLGIKKCLGVLIRHPFASVMALSIIPATLVVIDAGLALVFYFQKHLPFFALEFMPAPPFLRLPDGVPHFYGVDFRRYPPSRFFDSYFEGLRHGYTFTAAIPASLSLPTRTGLNPSIIYLNQTFYWIARVFITLVISICLITGFAVQAMWLGAIAAVEKKRPA
ncbi:hypothetical protein P12x_001281 [Tundrisphaera lichenicola]|uniref:hypothetical protein n=1 Tax=Tundrisphaera lichenicola TaxID=2029860 RepID=UPI003EBBEB18